MKVKSKQIIGLVFVAGIMFVGLSAVVYLLSLGGLS